MELPVKYDELEPSEKRAVREQYILIQGGNCCHCGEPLNGNPSKESRSKKVRKHIFPDNFFKYPIHLHHSHDTGLTIGAIHAHCNAVLWKYLGI